MASPRGLRACWAPSREAPGGLQPRVGHGLCLGSALLSLLGVLLLGALRRRRRRRRRPGTCRASDGRLAPARALRTAAVAGGCLGAAGILARSVLWLAVPNGVPAPLCVVVLTWVQYWFASHFWALFCYSLEACLLLRNPVGHRSVVPYYLLCWGMSAIQCLPGLLLLLLPPPAADAHCRTSLVLAHVLDIVPFAATYVPLALALLGSPVLFSRGLQAVPALLQRGMGMYTASERRQEEQLRKKFISLMLAFTACWMANVANEAFLLLELEPSWGQETWRWLHGATLTCWTIMAILNPLSGFLLTLGFSAWRSHSSCVSRRVSTWRTNSDMVDGSSRHFSSLPETTSDPALGFLVGPGMLEVSSLLTSLDTSTSMDFICVVPENSSVQPLHQGLQTYLEEGSLGRGSCKRFLGWSCRH